MHASRGVLWQLLNTGGKYRNMFWNVDIEEKRNHDEVLGTDFSHCNCTVSYLTHVIVQRCFPLIILQKRNRNLT